MNRQALRDQLSTTLREVETLRAMLAEADGERDEFVVLIYQARRSYRAAVAGSGKSGKRIERTVLDSYRRAMEAGYRGNIREWEALLRVGG